MAGLYGVETRIINQAVKRNIQRFPYLESLRSQSVILKIESESQRGKHLKFLPYTRQQRNLFHRGLYQGPGKEMLRLYSA